MTYQYDSTHGEHYTGNDDHPMASLSDREASAEFRACREIRDQIETLTTLIRNRRHALMSNKADEAAQELLDQAEEWRATFMDMMKLLEERG